MKKLLVVALLFALAIVVQTAAVHDNGTKTAHDVTPGPTLAPSV